MGVGGVGSCGGLGRLREVLTEQGLRQCRVARY